MSASPIGAPSAEVPPEGSTGPRPADASPAGARQTEASPAASPRQGVVPPQAAPPPDQRQLEALLAQGVDTHLGGILYLINLMQTLDLLEAFQDDWLPPAAISPWGVLEALGRGLLAAEGAAPLDDPIWWALASLDEREPGQLPGAALSGLAPPQPPAFRLPPAWVSRLPAAPDRLRWACTGGRLQAWFDQGYLLLDIPADPDPAAQLESELRDINLPTAPIPQAPDAPKIPLSGWLTEGLHPHLMHWLVRTIPYLHTYLDSLLPAGTPLSDRLLRLPARLYVTNSHVDLVARLAYVSVPVRMSGLDRSPGWLRHFGRVVQFHFK